MSLKTSSVRKSIPSRYVINYIVPSRAASVAFTGNFVTPLFAYKRSENQQFEQHTRLITNSINTKNRSRLIHINAVRVSTTPLAILSSLDSHIDRPISVSLSNHEPSPSFPRTNVSLAVKSEHCTSSEPRRSRGRNLDPSHFLGQPFHHPRSIS